MVVQSKVICRRHLNIMSQCSKYIVIGTSVRYICVSFGKVRLWTILFSDFPKKLARFSGTRNQLDQSESKLLVHLGEISPIQLSLNASFVKTVTVPTTP